MGSGYEYGSVGLLLEVEVEVGTNTVVYECLCNLLIVYHVY